LLAHLIMIAPIYQVPLGKNYPSIFGEEIKVCEMTTFYLIMINIKLMTSPNPFKPCTNKRSSHLLGMVQSF
jgi:hypothetical protein